jgi:hypothetical protein
MFKVYWTEGTTPRDEAFGSDKMREALQLCEALRQRRGAGEKISFITMCSENLPGNTTLEGVAEPSPDYDWKKRRV